jgi:hypothetical protein
MTPYRATIVWLDAHQDPTRQIYSLDDLGHEPLRVETEGWVVKEDATGVTTFSERIVNGDGTYAWRGFGFTPRGMIVEVVELGPKKRKRQATPPP